ncbi:hypothetical protein [Streptomyces sp. NPDC058240]|uniref:hypothetical protein n=1 Tax=Streptomyces sp. NPDC058240 TaxID=3346396 RepID=UPI0036F0211A
MADGRARHDRAWAASEFTASEVALGADEVINLKVPDSPSDSARSCNRFLETVKAECEAIAQRKPGASHQSTVGRRPPGSKALSNASYLLVRVGPGLVRPGGPRFVIPGGLFPGGV